MKLPQSGSSFSKTKLEREIHDSNKVHMQRLQSLNLAN